MKITLNKVVSLHYRLKKGGENGELVEETFNAEPMVYIHGIGNMIPKFEEYLESKAIGDKMNFTIEAEEAYGAFDEDAIIELPINLFKVEGIIDMEMLEVGNVLPMQDGDGNAMEGVVKNVTPEFVTMDFNHPLAGVDLNFEVEVLEIRDASKEELNHGHVHGEGGHKH